MTDSIELIIRGSEISNKQDVRYFFEQLEDNEYVLSVKRATRSLRQNNLYWKWVSVIGDEFGYFKNEMHEILIDMFAPVITFADLNNKPKQRKIRTSEMSVVQMKSYLEQIEIFASEHGIVLLDPDSEKYLINNRRLINVGQ